jgi:hemerythrin
MACMQRLARGRHLASRFICSRLRQGATPPVRPYAGALARGRSFCHDEFAAPFSPSLAPSGAAPMIYVAWSRKYSVNHDLLDNQHQVIFDTINELFAAIQAKKGDAVLLPIFQTLVKYTQTHFRDEERILAGIKYARLREHLIEHDQMARRTRLYYQEFKDGVYEPTQMLKFLKDWWVRHITESDMNFASLLG